MQKKKPNKQIKEIILYILVTILVLLLAFAEDILKLTQKNEINLAQSSETEIEIITNEPNTPMLSAGMIPVKWENDTFIITTKDDKDWYDYSNGKPAYIMLNDGTYQSELIRDMTSKELAENNVGVGVPDDPNVRGTIFMWIPRYVYNESGEIGYIKEETNPGEGWTLPDLFMYKIADETKPDFSLSGVWIQKDVDLSFANKITQMNKEESIYGFLAHTKATQITSNDTIELQKYVVGVGLDRPENQNRIILKIVNTSKYEPIKANITHNKIDEKIEIRVTYTANGIREVLDEYGDQLELTNKEGKIVAKTKYALATGTHIFTIVDNKGNKKELSITINVDSFYKVAYVDEIDNMDNTATYTKTQETKTSNEVELLNQIKELNTSKIVSRAIVNSNESITSVIEETRKDKDELLYFYKKYNAVSETEYNVEQNDKRNSGSISER